MRQRASQLPPHPTFVLVGDRPRSESRHRHPAPPGPLAQGAVAFTAGSVDVYNPKVVRSSTGSLFRLPVLSSSRAEVRRPGVRRRRIVAAVTDADLRNQSR